MDKLNKDCSISLYQQLADGIKKDIAEGKLKEGERIMTETELSRTYDISRITVRKAIEILVEDGVLIKKQGIGTFVASKRLTRNMGVFTGFTQNCETDGKKPGTRLLSASLEDPSGNDEKHLGIREGEKVIVIRRLRFIDDVPVLIEENHFSTSYAFLLSMDLEKSLYSLLREQGIFPYGGKRTVNIGKASREEASLLGIKGGSDLLVMKDICITQDGKIIHTCKSLIVPDRYQVVINTAPDLLS